jgi:class 3 adenylate cyclase
MVRTIIDDLLDIAIQGFEKAKRTAEQIGLSASVTENLKYARTGEPQFLSDRDEYKEIEEYHGLRAWCATLSFDIRRSTARALKIGPRDTFITMHTFLPTMLALAGRKGGSIVGLRGDGAIACFGLYEMYDRDTRVPPEKIGEGVKQAGICGDAMVRAVRQVVNPVLARGGVEAGLQIGVGIDLGEIVATNIGLGGARELTAYGDCVNHACKLNSGNDTVLLSRQARYTFPKGKGGKAGFRKHPTMHDAFILEYADEFDTIGDTS